MHLHTRKHLRLEVSLNNQIGTTTPGGLHCRLGYPRNVWKSRVQGLAMAGNGMSGLTGRAHLTQISYRA